MGTVYVLPGCMGSQLSLAEGVSTLPVGPAFAQQFFTGVYWADRGALVKYGLVPLTLDGTTSGLAGPGGQQFFVDGVLDDYYGDGMKALAKYLKGTAWENPQFHAYDWRLSMQAQAVFLASKISQRHTADNPCVLIGHSMGGLISRLAYRILAGQSKANLIRRIICLGTPHDGTLRVWQAWSGESREGWLFSMAKAVQGAGFFGPVILPVFTANVVAVMMTWPSFYELLPPPLNDGSDEDKFRKLLYVKDSWQFNAGWSQALRDNALQGTQLLLSDLTSIPPGNKIVSIIGQGFPTPQFVKQDNLGVPWIPKSGVGVGRGDGCTLLSKFATEPGQKIYVDCAHENLFNALGGSQLGSLVLQNFDPAPTAQIPPAKTVGNPLFAQIVEPPPFKDITPPAKNRRGRPKR